MSKLFEEMKAGLEEAVAFAEGKDVPSLRVWVPDQINTRRIRGQLAMSQQQFATAFGFSVDAVRHWEAGRRCPEAAAQALLRVIDHDAATVQRALGTGPTKSKAKPGEAIRRITPRKANSSIAKSDSKTLASSGRPTRTVAKTRATAA